MTYTPDQAAQIYDDWGVQIDPLDVAHPPPTPPAPKHDVAKIRKAYSKLLAAMAAAKDSGDEELLETLKPDYLAVKALLTEAKAEERELELQANAAREQEVQALREQIATARKTIAALKTDNERLRDELTTLRSPPPTAEYRKAQTMTQTPIRTFADGELDAEMDAIFGPKHLTSV